jgi:regulator of protease activity HflC (stomatin/prohibitin superfamily)
MRPTVAVIVLLASGCGAVIEPGHRGLLFDAGRGGLGKEVLGPGFHRVGLRQRIEDFDVTYSTRIEQLHALSKEGLAMDVELQVIYRPVIEELYDLDHEIGPSYYDEVIGPETRSAAREWFATNSFQDVTRDAHAIEDRITEAARRRVTGRHVELYAVVMTGVHYSPEIERAVRERLVLEQELAKKKLQLESESQTGQLNVLIEAQKEHLRMLEQAREAQQRALDKARNEMNEKSEPPKTSDIATPHL